MSRLLHKYTKIAEKAKQGAVEKNSCSWAWVTKKADGQIDVFVKGFI